ncbi:hypothetical protein [Chengkuizengella axinellae]|uniref:Uncharacterized protein n=1 Tax=Chengkuizengella axinellae TaxID=3064388 RepID=A0ABT9J2V1_9BACL|nr:hypothetical protein [Chengkuizengella sp. 2205SS18-9]MDP5275946.1 hypothetical protein [Chengkuizengella sp. 2205SS18-9]
MKIHVGFEEGFVKASMVHTGDQPTFTEENVKEGTEFRVVLNIRIESSPSLLNLAVADAIASTGKLMQAEWLETYNECFSPLPPKPVHRLYKAI